MFLYEELKLLEQDFIINFLGRQEALTKTSVFCTKISRKWYFVADSTVCARLPICDSQCFCYHKPKESCCGCIQPYDSDVLRETNVALFLPVNYL